MTENSSPIYDLETVIEQLIVYEATFNPDDMRFYCFEFACRLLEGNHLKPMYVNGEQIKYLINKEATRVLEKVRTAYESGHTAKLTFQYTGVEKR